MSKSKRKSKRKRPGPKPKAYTKKLVKSLEKRLAS